MRLLIDEDLSPVLVVVCHDRGHEAAAIRDRARLGLPDWDVLALCLEEDMVLVTANFGDFRVLCARTGLHPGLIVLPSVSRERQRFLLAVALEHAERRAGEEDARPAAFMVNKVIEVDANAACADYDLP